VELQEVETIHPHTRERCGDCFLDHAARHGAWIGHPFGEGLDLGQSLGAVADSELLPESPDKVFGRAVVVGKVPGFKARIVVGKHRFDRARRVDTAMSTGDLPHPV
jgi:hypothetical protein